MQFIDPNITWFYVGWKLKWILPMYVIHYVNKLASLVFTLMRNLLVFKHVSSYGIQEKNAGVV